MEFNRDKRHILQTMGISDFDVNRYLDIEEKLKTYRQVFCENINDSALFTFFASLYFPKASVGPSKVELFGQEKSAETHSALINAVREQIERSLQPLRTAVNEIKASVVRELEEERVLLRDHLAAAQKEIMAQLQEICLIQDQQLNQSESCHSHPDKDIQVEEIDAQEQLAGQGVQQKFIAEGPQKGIRTAEKRSDVKGHDQQMPDINSELLWFKEQVQLLQNEHKQYRQELRRQEQQQLLQHRVSVSKLELKEELGRTKDEIITSIKALWAFTEAELNDSSKSLNEKTTDAVCELSRCQEETKQILTAILTTASDTNALAKENSIELKEETKQMLAKILTTASDTKALANENSSELKEETIQMLTKIHTTASNTKVLVKKICNELKEGTKQMLTQIMTTASDTKALAKENSNELKEGTKQVLTKILATASDTKALAKENSNELKEGTKQVLTNILTTASDTKALAKENSNELKERTKQVLTKILTTASDTKALAKENSNELKERTKQVLTKILTTASDTKALAKENSNGLKKAHQVMEKSDMRKTIHSMEGKLDNIQKRVETDTISIIENAFSDLHMVCLGQAQRVIQTVVDPSYAPSKIFHFYLKNFQQLVGSGKKVFSPPYAVTINNSILVMHLLVVFNTQPSEMISYLVSAADPRELGFELLESLELMIDVRVKRFKSPDNILVAEGIKISGDLFSGSKFRFLKLGKPISCPELVSSEYNNFKDNSVLIELKIR
ncbi:hypothetical protein PoB_007272200 [Plakobranchus ocellatus]|uniref:Uncharacterized protein n=1 Tax=Plakobranchus ocellatus TaxID=259542 RepID=A0AAV4DPD0_9GAST|nr:hypothetical protein PoB_007272200 [Plakobranchus ocellatus]